MADTRTSLRQQQEHEHGHSHDEAFTEPPADVPLRVKALESLLVEKGLVDLAAIDRVITSMLCVSRPASSGGRAPRRAARYTRTCGSPIWKMPIDR